MINHLEVNKPMKLREVIAHFCNGVNTIIYNENNYVKGVFTIGDFVKAISYKKNLNEEITKFLNKNYKYVYDKTSDREIKKVFLKYKDLIDLVVVDKFKKYIKILKRQDYVGYDKYFKNINFVVMAGGKGERLLPFTKYLPKALYYKNDKILISSIIDSFKNFGFKRGYICLNYKSNLIKSYLKETEKKISLKFFTEKKFLGTVGGLSLLKKNLSENFFLTNCDLLIDFDYKSLMDFHLSHNNDLTIISAYRNIKIPYGCCEISKGGILKSIKEKPNFQYLFNTGFYIMKKKLIDNIKKNQPVDMDKFINVLLKKKKKIRVFPVPEKNWIDFVEEKNI